MYKKRQKSLSRVNIKRKEVGNIGHQQKSQILTTIIG